MKLGATAANLLWAGASVPAWQRYRWALDEPLLVQGALLARYLHENRETAFGRRYDFGGVLATADHRAPASESVARDLAREYQARVPVSTYDDIEPFIQRVRTGEPGVLTRSAVRRLVPSSGSTAAIKLIPSTSDGQRELNRAVDAWIADLYLRQPSLVGGPAYWSISPAIPTDRTGPVPIGFDADSAYLGVVRQSLTRTILAVPEAISAVRDGEACRYATLLFLLRARDLRLISIWHPTFLTRLLDDIPRWLDCLARDISRGTLTPPVPIDEAVREELQRFLAPDTRRAAEVRCLRSADPCAIWPRLKAISCWADGPAKAYAEQLEKVVPLARVQPKGLIATEGIVTIPFQRQHPLAIRSHFFEFLDSHNQPCLAHELETGKEYIVVLTTGGGLYRYRLGDRVEVDGRVGRTPSVRFLGKDDRISDRFGEKLSDGFVASVIETLFGRQRPRFVMLAPERVPAGTAYTLFVESDKPMPSTLTAALERALRRNPHYAWCVDIGQLRPARTVRVGPNADRAYVDACVAKGQRLGDVKPVSLHRDSGWESALPGVLHPDNTERPAC